MAYLPLLDVLRSYFEIKEGDQELLVKRKLRERVSQVDEKLRTVLPPFFDLFSLKGDDAAYGKLQPKERREKTFEALRDLFVRESQKDPLVLVIEDLHWIDTTSEEFLGYLISFAFIGGTWMTHARTTRLRRLTGSARVVTQM